MKKLSLISFALLGVLNAMAQPMPDAEPTNVPTSSVDGMEFYVLALVLISFAAFRFTFKAKKA